MVVNVKSIFIMGHQIEFISKTNNLLDEKDLDEEIYAISQKILEGYNDGEIFVFLLKEIFSWRIKN